ncbi:MAG: SIR2 family protein, partial [Kofleriaceae bacterium]|nr:SIR2 family protein [Kofleriaceae bacterium]
MPEHTIPKSLVENIRKGRAAIVVGAGIGVPSWKKLLERMNAKLRERGQDTDEAYAKDVDKLLHKGNLVRASAFLGRQLGSDICDKVVRDTWATEAESPEVAKALATLPIRQMWTTFPGDVLEHAIAEHLPDEWPLPKVLTYKQAGEIDPRHRTLLKVLGDFDSYIATPLSIRKALSDADELREFIKPFYAEGSLLFVGFRYGDPDLAALLDRVFGAFEPTQSDHFLACASVGPVTVDELSAEHHIQVLQLPGKGADDEATSGLLELLASLAEECKANDIDLSQTRPEEDDLEGWIGLLVEDSFDRDAMDAIAAIETKAKDSGDGERLIEVLMGRLEYETTGAQRAELLRTVADVFQNEVGDIPGAFTALTVALREDPSDFRAVESAEKLADEAEGWSELVSDVAGIVGEIT